MVGTIMGLLGQVGASVGSIVNNKKKENEQSAKQADSNNYFNKALYQNPLERSENAALLRNLNKNAKKASEQARNIAAVTGQNGMAQTAETITQKQNANALADATSTMSAGESARRDKLMEQQYQANQAFHDDEMKRLDERNVQLGNLVTNASKLVGTGIDGMIAGAGAEAAEGAAEGATEGADEAIGVGKKV